MVKCAAFILLVSLFIELTICDDVEIDPIDLSQYGSTIFGKPSEATGDKVVSWLTSELFNETNPEEMGEYLEGDILIPSTSGLAKSGLILEAYRWPNGVVPFVINANFNDNDMNLIEKAILEYHKHTCIRFVYKQPTDVDYISIESEDTGCWSSIGRYGGKQIVNFQNPGCLVKVGTIIHELMHALGFFHEQNREERDNHVTVYYNNIKKGSEDNFIKLEKGLSTGFGVGYDYGSVMHYSQYAFSSNNQPTLVPKARTSEQIGQRDGFSVKDIAKIKAMYKCKN